MTICFQCYTLSIFSKLWYINLNYFLFLNKPISITCTTGILDNFTKTLASLTFLFCFEQSILFYSKSFTRIANFCIYVSFTFTSLANLILYILNFFFQIFGKKTFFEAYFQSNLNVLSISKFLHFLLFFLFFEFLLPHFLSLFSFMSLSSFSINFLLFFTFFSCFLFFPFFYHFFVPFKVFIVNFSL